ncbi:unnamed protein product [marine sediment metagenome]|uniref:Uncharacterized protein n=1 Tax=marine sediment metagenome TaxID=412755 RepID=X1CDE5_9ZZZZ
MGANESLKGAETVFLALLTIGLMGLLFLIIYGNLSTNLGFAADTAGYNNTEAVIANLTGGATQFFEFANVWFILTAITILIGIVLGVIALVRRAGVGGKGGFSE